MTKSEALTDVVKVVNGLGFIAVPALAYWKNLPWFLKDTEKILVSVGGLLSSVLYSYLVWTEPSKSLINISILWYLAISLASVALYYGLYSHYRGSAGRAVPAWLFPAALVSFSCVLCAVGFFCAAALARHSYLIVGGTIYGGQGPLAGANIELQDVQNVIIRSGRSDQRGRYLLTLRYPDAEEKDSRKIPKYLHVEVAGYNEETSDFDGHPNEHCDFRMTSLSSPTDSSSTPP